MGKRNPNSRSLGNRRNPKTSVSPPLPAFLRAQGIGTQRELVVALLPYMEWVKYTDLRSKFWKIVKHHRCDAPLRKYLCYLAREGVIEKAYGEAPKEKNNSSYRLNPYLFVRRIKREIKKHPFSQLKINGTFGLKKRKEQARRALGEIRIRKPGMKNLTLEDVRYIQANPLGMSARQLGEMFSLGKDSAADIRRGHIPHHLKGRLAR